MDASECEIEDSIADSQGWMMIIAGTVGTLKQSKKDVQEVLKGVECGIALEEFSLYAVGDIIQSVEEIEIARTL